MGDNVRVAALGRTLDVTVPNGAVPGTCLRFLEAQGAVTMLLLVSATATATAASATALSATASSTAAATLCKSPTLTVQQDESTFQM